MRIDLHLHSEYSGHSLLKVERISEIAKKMHLDAVALTDHNEIAGALKLSKIFPTIVGEEISCDEGDVVGLFLKQKIDSGPAIEVMEKIRDQGGLVMIPHPFDSLRREALMSEEICIKGDMIEVFNSRVMRKEDNQKALAFAEKVGLPKVVGSDAHTSREIGRSWMDIESADDPSSFMRSLQTAKLHTKRSPIIVHVQTRILKAREVFR